MKQETMVRRASTTPDRRVSPMDAQPPVASWRRVVGVRALRGALDARFGTLPAWVVAIEVFFGLGWLRAAAEKVVDGSWWNTTVVNEFIVTHSSMTLPWYQPVIDNVVEPRTALVAVIVVQAQIVAAVTLIIGWRRSVGLAVGTFLSVNFLAAGAVNPAVFYLVGHGALALWYLEQRGERERTRRTLAAMTVVSLLLAGISLPFISTVDPAAVIDDPAAVLVFVGALFAASSDVARRRLLDLTGSVKAQLVRSRLRS